MSDMPPEIAREIAAMGPVFSPDVLAKTRALYAPLVKAIPLIDVKITRDVSYGPDERQKLDVGVKLFKDGDYDAATLMEVLAG